MSLVATVAALQWRNGPYPNREFQGKWEQVIHEWSRRWGKKVAGWWFDGCYFPNSMYRSPQAPNFASLAAAVRSGNPDAAIAFNPGIVYRTLSLTPYGGQIHMLSYLGATWGMGSPRFSTEQAVNWSRKATESGGAITWDAPVELNGMVSQPFLDQLAAVGKALGSKQ